jgi:hypothetical protein
MDGRVEGIIFFPSYIYLSIYLFFFFPLHRSFFGCIYNDHVEHKHNQERTEWTKQMVAQKVGSDDDDDLRLSVLVWYDVAFSHFYHKVNRILWYRKQRMRKTFVWYIPLFFFKLVASKSFLTIPHMCIYDDVVVVIIFSDCARTRIKEINRLSRISISTSKKNVLMYYQ